jgi:hypothetical protein
MVSWDMEGSMVWRVEDGPPIMEVDADMPSWLAGREALVGFGVDGECEGVDLSPKELGEVIAIQGQPRGSIASAD